MEKLSAKKLEALQAKRHARWGEALDATIAAGMGDCRHSDIVEIAKGSSLLSRTQIALDYLNARRDMMLVEDEIDRRRKYSGTLKPIKPYINA